MAGEDVHGGGVGADGGGVDPWDGLLDGEVVEEVTGLEVVGGVEEYLDGWGGQRWVWCEELGDVGRGEVGDVRVDGDGGVEAGDVTAGGLGLGEGFTGVGLVEEDLALEVGGFDEVAVDEGERAYASACEQRGGSRAHGSAADNGDMSGSQALLAGGANPGEEDLAGVAVGVGYGRGFFGCGRGVRLGVFVGTHRSS